MITNYTNDCFPLQLDREDTCVEFTARRNIFVKDPRNGVITVFDYYEKGQTLLGAGEFKFVLSVKPAVIIESKTATLMPCKLLS